jgi:hypothetical protein
LRYQVKNDNYSSGKKKKQHTLKKNEKRYIKDKFDGVIKKTFF